MLLYNCPNLFREVIVIFCAAILLFFFATLAYGKFFMADIAVVRESARRTAQGET